MPYAYRVQSIELPVVGNNKICDAGEHTSYPQVPKFPERCGNTKKTSTPPNSGLEQQNLEAYALLHLKAPFLLGGVSLDLCLQSQSGNALNKFATAV